MQKYCDKYPEKYKAKNISLKVRRLLKLKKEIHLHHWSYNEEHYIDIIQLSIEEHNFLHRYIKYDQETLMYRTKEGELLDTKEKHVEYFNYLKANFE